jgi:lysophospholipase L1-like esterase
VDTQAIPGLTLEKATQRVNDGTFVIRRYSVIILHVATNNIESDTPEQICEKMKGLIESVRNKNPSARIAISGILPRLKDEHNPIVEENRRKANSKMRKMGKSQGVYFLESWKAVEVKEEEESDHPHSSNTTLPLTDLTDSTGEVIKLSKKGYPKEEKREPEVDRNCYADDLLHLNDKGIDAMHEFLKGNVANLISHKTLWTKTKGKKIKGNTLQNEEGKGQK